MNLQVIFSIVLISVIFTDNNYGIQLILTDSLITTATERTVKLIYS